MDDRKQGGMTGATGNLTPDEPDEAFVPAETREISDPAAARQLTASAHRRAEARQAEGHGDPGWLPDIEADSAPNARDGGGHGSEQGISPDDPGPMLGGDERSDPEKEHL
jgi:hypothetical protein